LRVIVRASDAESEDNLRSATSIIDDVITQDDAISERITAVLFGEVPAKWPRAEGEAGVRTLPVAEP
jgi:hypothetical protein